MKTVLVLCCVLFSLCLAQLAVPDPPCTRPLPPCVDPNCHCQFDWIGPEGRADHWRLKEIYYGSFHDFDNWSPAPILYGFPCEVCFVNITGFTTVFIDRDTKLNVLRIGGNQWDDSVVFVGGAGRNKQNVTLTISYDDIPKIKVVRGERLPNGQTLLTITGKGFGFCAADLNITVVDLTQDRPKWSHYNAPNCDYPLGCDYPGIPSIIPVPGDYYTCDNVRIYFLDQKIQCTVAIPDVFAEELEVIVQVNIRTPPLSDSARWLSKYMK